MLLNAANLDALRVGFKTTFQNALGAAQSQCEQIITSVPASTKEQKFGWLGMLPEVREWIGSRAVQNLQQYDYTIREKKWELTIGVDRDDIETDNLGIYTPMFANMGQRAVAHKEQLVFDLLKSGFSTNCYDGQFFFDTDHPVVNADGTSGVVANTDGGTGTGWYLLDVSRHLKPIIWQERKGFEFVAKDRVTDDTVFDNNEFLYGLDARHNVGLGLWQFAWGSKQALNATNYATARKSLLGMKGDHSTPIGVMPNLLVVPPELEAAAREILMNERTASGATNTWRGTAELLVVPWLA